MIEPTGLCPLCKADFGSEDNTTNCPECGIQVYKFVPIIRLSRSWFWHFTDEAIAQLRELWLAHRKKK